MRSSSKWMKPTLDHDTPNYPLDEFWLQHSPQLSWATPNPSNDPSKPRSLRSYNSMVRPYSEFRLTPPPNKKKKIPPCDLTDLGRPSQGRVRWPSQVSRAQLLSDLGEFRTTKGERRTSSSYTNLGAIALSQGHMAIKESYNSCH